MSLKKILIVSGTHGNEINPVWAVNQFIQKKNTFDKNIEYKYIIGNPLAFKKGYRKKRIPSRNDRPDVEGYDSNWEYLLHTTILKDWTIHAETLDYIVAHKYHHDYIRDIEGKKIL